MRSNPRFSIVIPTRERADTLRFALKSCLDQEFDDYEIVVCDNCSSPATRDVVDSLASPRIVYHRSPTPLCMRDNWNLAYGLTSGQYVGYIGDDDGLMPYALAQLDALIRREGAKAITWDCALYSWPNIARSDLANYIALSVTRTRKAFEGRQAIRDVITGCMPATLLPNIYHGLVAREVLERIRARTGHVFASYAPDTYTSFAVAYLVDRYLSLAAPMTVSGFSASSNNIASNFLRSKHPNTQRYKNECTASGLELHPWVPDLPAGWVAIADSFLVAKADLFPDDSSLALDRKFLAEIFLEKLPIDDLDELPDVLAAIRGSLSDDADLVAWFDARARQIEPKVYPRDTFRAQEEGLHGRYLHLDTSKYGVEEVASAVSLASRILRYGTKPIVWDAQEPSEGGLQRFLNRARFAIRLSRLRRGGPAAR